MEILGQGAFGTVQKAYNIKECCFVALKTFQTDEQDALEDIISEDNFLTAVQAINNQCQRSNNTSPFLEYYGVFTIKQESQLSLVLEMESGLCTLNDLLQAGKVFTYPEILYILKELVKAFALLQQKGLVNRDVKAQNVILVQEADGYFSYKISDFGESFEMAPGTSEISCQTITGATMSYIAPEVERVLEKAGNDPDYNEMYNPFKGDVYSLGIILLKMINRKWGKKDLRKGLLIDQAALKDYILIQPILQEMLEESPNKRVDFIQLLALLDSQKNLTYQRPVEEFHYYVLSLNIKDQAVIDKGFDALVGLYIKYYSLSIAYFRNTSRNKESLFNLQRAWRLLQGAKEKKTDLADILKGFKEKPPIEEEEKKNKEQLVLKEIQFLLEEIKCLIQFGSIYQNLGDLPKSKGYYDKSLEIWEKFEEYRVKEEINEISNETLVSWSSYKSRISGNLASIYGDMGNLKKSEEYLLEALKIAKEIYGESHSLTNLWYNDLAFLYSKMGNLSKSEEFHQRSLKEKLILFGENHSETATSYNNLATIYLNMGDFTKAEELYQKALKTYIFIFGENHSHTAMSINNLGALYRNMGDYPKAKEYHERSLKIKLILFGENHSDTALSYSNLGELYRRAGDLLKGEEFNQRALKIRLTLFGENNSETATSYNNLATIYQNMGDFTKAEELYKKALKTYITLFGESHSLTAIAYSNLSFIYEKFGNRELAKDFSLKAYKICLGLFGAEHHVTKENLENFNKLNVI